MKKYLVIGNPIEHSLSPTLHNYWIKKNNIDAKYEKKLIQESDIERIVHEIKDDKINGVIDFYYSCKDYFVIDLAIIIISWCLIYNEKRKISLDENKVKKLLAGYNKIKNIKIIELNSLNIFCKIFCIRFYISRLIDAKQKHDRSIVKTKNPKEYIDKYLYFKNSNLEFTRFF